MSSLSKTHQTVVPPTIKAQGHQRIEQCWSESSIGRWTNQRRGMGHPRLSSARSGSWTSKLQRLQSCPHGVRRWTGRRLLWRDKEIAVSTSSTRVWSVRKKKSHLMSHDYDFAEITRAIWPCGVGPAATGCTRQSVLSGVGGCRGCKHPFRHNLQS